MRSDASTPIEYIDSLPADRIKAVKKLRATIRKNLPDGFREIMNYGMLGYVVPHSLYPSGYHCKPDTPLPFINLASQKNYIALYHLGIYNDPNLLKWFTAEYKLRVPSKLDMGKSCIRFKNIEDIPYDLIGELAGKITVKQWIEAYEKAMS